MNETNGENERIERILGQVHLPGPSDALRTRVTGSTRQVWGQAPTDIPWQVPLRRLALSAAAAVVIVSLANHFSDFGIREDNRRYHAATPAEVSIPEASVSPLMNRLIQTGRRSSRTHAPALRRYMENVQKILQETEDRGTREAPAPTKSGSRLLRSHLDSRAYS